MTEEYQLRVLPQAAYDEDNLKAYIAREKGLDERTIYRVRTLKRSIDARHRDIFVNLKVRVYINEFPQDDAFVKTEYRDVSSCPAVIVVGEGPAGLFSSLKLIELGLRPIILERGKNVRDRKTDIASIKKTQTVDPESNYCFGEGGAGAYSDGKLYTRSKKRGNVDKILRIFAQFGAQPSILYDAHPHIGTDRLPLIIEAMRKQIIESGGEVHFQTCVDGLLRQEERVVGVRTTAGAEFLGPVILATGHSARDVYRFLRRDGIRLEAKGIAVGVRLEHPSQLIDRLQYHNPQGRGKYLPAAEYNYVAQCDGRGVYSFCMCPGGIVVPAATGARQIVVNGMSPSHRNTAWSNSGMVVETRLEDLDGELRPFMEERFADPRFSEEHSDYFDAENPLRMLYFQEALEETCWLQGNQRQTAPAQRMQDFVRGRLSFDLPKSSYAPGLVSSPLHFWMPTFITKRLQAGFEVFGRRSRGFLTNDALLIAAETRTSSPVRIVRDALTLQHLQHPGLYPCGEGAGYAGGIVSSAIDGERCAASVAANMGL